MTIDFSAPAPYSEASASLSAASAVTGASGQASVTATANATDGAYAVTASAAGVTSSASFNLTNQASQVHPVFSRLADQTIPYGTASVDFTGTLAAGSQVPRRRDRRGHAGRPHARPRDRRRRLVLDDIPHSHAAGEHSTAYTVTYAFTAQGIFLAASGLSQLTVNPLAVVLTGSRSYDGTTTASSGILTVSNLIGSDVVTVAAGNATLAGKDVGSQAITNATGLTLGGASASDYTVTGATGSVTVNALALTLSGLTAGNKTYDGNTTATITTYGSLSGIISPDSVTLDSAAASAAFSDKDAGTGKTVAVTGLALTGTDAADYSIGSQTTTADIDALTANLTGSRTYDGTTAAAASILTVSNAITGDTVNVASGSATLAGKDVGAQTITNVGTLTLGNNAAGDYTLTGTTGSVTVNALALTASITADGKVYDGTTAAVDHPTLTGVITGDTVALVDGTATFASSYVGTWTVTDSGITITGADAGNYTVNATATTMASITKANATISVTPYAVTYDGTAHTATGTATGVLGETLSGLVLNATTHTNAGTYADTWTFTDSTGNYNNTSGTVNDSIARAAVIVTAHSFSKTYGDTFAFTDTEFTDSGLLNGDTITTVALTSGGAAATAHVAGSPYAIVPSDAAGNGLGNYAIAYHDGSLTVNPAPLTVTADNKATSFGGTVPPLTASYAGFVNGETPASLTTPVNLSTSATSNSPAGAYPIAASGASSSDYAISYVNGTLTIAPYVPPAKPRYRAADGFVTTLYNEILGRGPEPSGFQGWMRRYLAGASTRGIWQGFVRSPERVALDQQGREPTIPLKVAYSDALLAARQAAAQPAIAPAGPLALRKSSHARASTGGVLPYVHARPRGAGRA